MPRIPGKARILLIDDDPPLLTSRRHVLVGWGLRLVATGDVPADVVAVMSKPPNIAELRDKLAECIGEQAQ